MSPEQKREDSLSSLRFLAVRVFLALSALLIVADIIGRLFKDASFHADPIVAGLVFGTLLSLLGLETIQKVLDK